MSTLEALKQYVIDGNAPEVESGVQKALEERLTPDAILYQALIPAMAEVGARFERQEFFVPEMLVAARAMQHGMEVLRPLLVESGVQPIAKVVIGTVQGDLHDIGKKLVAMMLEGAGFEVLDLGVDVKPDQFVKAAAEGAQVVAMSALLTTTMANMKTVIKALDEAGVRDKVKIIIGGAPVTEAFAANIGADGYAPDASSAVTRTKALLGLG